MFIGYSQTQNAYKCLDLSTNRLYLSCHILLDETQTPFQIISIRHTSSPSSSRMDAPPIDVPTPPKPSLVTSDRATTSASPLGTTFDLPSFVLD